MASRRRECPGCVPKTDIAVTEFASHEINPKPPFSHYRLSGEEGEAPLPAGTCCRVEADGRHRSRHRDGRIGVPRHPCIELAACAFTTIAEKSADKSCRLCRGHGRCLLISGSKVRVLVHPP